jgi:hypothetical protein
MANIRSRAYKLQLSLSGIELFLRCHCRLCHKAGDFLPYGTTLFVAVSLLHRCAPQTMVDSLLAAEVSGFGGRLVRFVGTSPAMAGMVNDIARKLEMSEDVAGAPPVWKIFLVALDHMEDTADAEVMQIFNACIQRSGRKTR